MGCGGAKAISVDDSMRQVSESPAKGLPNLLNAIGHPDQQAEGTKNVPGILKMMPKVIEGLTVTQPKPIIAACDVIQQCVQLHEKGGYQPAVDEDTPKVLAERLSALLKNVESQARQCQVQNYTDCEDSTREAKAIANAFAALFKLEGHADRCKAAYMNNEGLHFSCRLIDTNSGCKTEGKQALAVTLSALCDKFSNGADGIIAKGALRQFRKIVEEGKSNGLPKVLQFEMCTLLEAIIANASKAVEDKDAIEAAIQACRAGSKNS